MAAFATMSDRACPEASPSLPQSPWLSRRYAHPDAVGRLAASTLPTSARYNLQGSHKASDQAANEARSKKPVMMSESLIALERGDLRHARGNDLADRVT